MPTKQITRDSFARRSRFLWFFLAYILFAINVGTYAFGGHLGHHVMITIVSAVLGVLIVTDWETFTIEAMVEGITDG